MGRQKKRGVEYFPHDCVSGKTLFIIEQKYGNDGYALWFKLLESIGIKEGHVINYNDPTEREFLCAKFRLDEISASKILDDLAKLDAIDSDLWAKRIIWVTGFVGRISDVYVKRRTEIPAKPKLSIENPGSAGISGAESTQTKLKESKVKKRESTRSPFSPRQPNIPTVDQVREVFHRQGGTREMADAFFAKWDAVGWYDGNSPITNYVAKVGRFISNYLSFESRSNGHEQQPTNGKLDLNTII